jgi:hypothetical protein
MGISTTQVPFFSDQIAIRPHTASCAAHLGRKLTVRRFAGVHRVSLESVHGSDELIFRRDDGIFAIGPEV